MTTAFAPLTQLKDHGRAVVAEDPTPTRKFAVRNFVATVVTLCTTYAVGEFFLTGANDVGYLATAAVMPVSFGGADSGPPVAADPLGRIIERPTAHHSRFPLDAQLSAQLLPANPEP